ncbi:MAG: hypothetical protein JXR91_16795 [Deltaproteobacteria bacterium]|nr:hypothetical protein [Deltaproteobacteria bacterium]
MRNNQLKLRWLIILLLVASSSFSGCRLITNSRAGMQVKVNNYFKEDGQKYPKLDDKLFTLKMRVSGVITPQKFVKEIGVWIFLTEPYDPKKIPLLLVHGHWSGPPPLQELSESIDRTRFQPWFVYYPSGLDVRKTAQMLAINLARLADYYKKDEIPVIAYSMGGVVARQAIIKGQQMEGFPHIPLFIGVANPWDGSIKTNSGSKTAIMANPDEGFSYGAESWKQVYNHSPYIRGIFKYSLPKETEFHIIYSVGGHNSKLPGRDDGVLHEASLARPEAVAEAKSVTVLETPTHQNIISHYLAIKRINEILNSWPDKNKNSEPVKKKEVEEESKNQ